MSSGAPRAHLRAWSFNGARGALFHVFGRRPITAGNGLERSRWLEMHPQSPNLGRDIRTTKRLSHATSEER
jgi:hypothetical protein